MSEKEELAKQYNCQPSDIDVKVVTHDDGGTSTTVTVSAQVNIEGDFNI